MIILADLHLLIALLIRFITRDKTSVIYHFIPVIRFPIIVIFRRMKRITVLFVLSVLMGGLIWGQEKTQADTIAVDTTAAIVRTWILAEDNTLLKDISLDTMQTGFQVYNPAYQNSISNSYLGNIGTPVRNNLLYWNQKAAEYLFLEPFIPYMYRHDNTVFYNVRKPFTLLGYNTAITSRLKREESFQALHTQNVSPFFNFGAEIRLRNSEGQYLNQRARTVNFRGWMSYIKGDYSIHASYNNNLFDTRENGGLENDSLFRHTSGDERTYTTNLNNARSQLKNNDLQITQRYRFGKESTVTDTSSLTGIRRLRERTTKTGSLMHTIHYTRNRRLYEDDFSQTGPEFYHNFYNDSLITRDSTFHRMLSNTIQLMLDENPNRKTDFGARMFLTHELTKYMFSKPVDTVISANNDTIIEDLVERQYNDISVGASLVHTVGKGWNWIFKGKTWLTGYRAGDLFLSGEITKFIPGRKQPSFVSVAARFSLAEPDYYYQHFASNHFIWENDFSKIKELLATLNYNNPNLGLDVRAFYSVLTDYIYVGTDTMPAQFNKGLLLIGGIAREHLVLGPFHSIHTLAYQFASNRFIVRIPDIAYYTSNFLAFPLVRDVLTLETGFDFYYNTSFSAYGFVPATGFFYNQDVRKLGSYPYLDLFLTAKLKRTRAFFKLEHPYAQMIEKNYFQVLNYPMSGMTMKFGLSWSFYD